MDRFIEFLSIRENSVVCEKIRMRKQFRNVCSLGLNELLQIIVRVQFIDKLRILNLCIYMF